MSGFLSKLFGGKQKKEIVKPISNVQPKSQGIEAQETSWLSNYPDSEVEFLIREIKRSPYVNHKYDNGLIAHINKEIDIFSQGDYLKAFTPYALEMHVKPKDILFSIKRNASTKFHFIKQISKFKDIKINKFEYMSAGDERDCDWCIENNKKIFNINDNLILNLENNCKCQYCRSTILAFLDW
ncbi:hypothetical protein [Proteus mirabilis]|uniref:hypothetical protein n=1 Tax=Proteus mirabilis TaxID=584 RepID=UPI0013300523|nr:hypothetical protein [Proteus mirabilis]